MLLETEEEKTETPRTRAPSARLFQQKIAFPQRQERIEQDFALGLWMVIMQLKLQKLGARVLGEGEKISEIKQCISHRLYHIDK